MEDTALQGQAQAIASEHLVTATAWFEGLHALVITTDEQQEQVVSVLCNVKERYRVIEEKRKEITVPLNQALKAVNDLFRPPREKFEELEKVLKGKIASYLESKAAANAAALQAASVAPTPAEAQQNLSVLAPVAPPTGVSVRYVWKFEVTDPDAVPREYCSPDPKKIAAADPATAQIPGVRFFQESVVSARSR